MKMLCVPVGELEANCYLLRAENGQGLIVDPGDEPERLLSTVRQLALTPIAVVLTHAHFDHMDGAAKICAALSIPLWVHEADAPALNNPMTSLYDWFGRAMPLFPAAGRCLREGDVLAFGGEQLTVLATPGHTPGSICLLGEGVLFSGDTLFAGGVGRMDFPGGDSAALRRSLCRLMELPPETAVYPGHGPETTIAGEGRENPFLI